jgi:hypothetical protein
MRRIVTDVRAAANKHGGTAAWAIANTKAGMRHPEGPFDEGEPYCFGKPSAFNDISSDV